MTAMDVPSPPPEGPSELERNVRALCTEGRVEEATGIILRTHGTELLGFLHAISRRPADADDAFGVLSAWIWRSLPAFEWRSSLRTWLYVLARRSVARVTRGQRHEDVPLSQASALQQLAAEVRATSMPQLAAVRDRFAEIRAQLEPDDQILLVLRVDRELPWREVAAVLSEEGDDLDRVAAALRKRFERVKVRIRSLAIEAGLIPD